MDYRITTHEIEPQAIVSIRDRRRQEDLPGFLQMTFPQLLGRLGLLGVGPSGPPLVIYHEFGADGIDAEVCFPTSEPVPTAGEIESRVLPAMTVARTVHVGRYERLGEAYAAVSAWTADHGFVAAGPFQERYLDGPGDDVSPSEYVTEVEVPIVPLGVAAPV